MNKRTNSYTIVEILVVVAIIAILSAIAKPYYQEYFFRAQIDKYIKLMQGYVDLAKANYESTGAYPTSITVNGFTVNSGAGLVTVSWSDVYSVAYTRAADGKGLMLELVTTAGNFTSGYAAPSSGLAGTNTAIFYATRTINGIYYTGCGGSGDLLSNGVIPAAYLPLACQCTNLSPWYTNGTAAPTCP